MNRTTFGAVTGREVLAVKDAALDSRQERADIARLMGQDVAAGEVLTRAMRDAKSPEEEFKELLILKRNRQLGTEDAQRLAYLRKKLGKVEEDTQPETLKYIVSLREGRAVVAATSSAEASRIGKQQFPGFVRVVGLMNGTGA